MAASNTTILLRKTGTTNRVDIEEEFGASVLEEPMLFPTEVKDTGSRDWQDEHGIDVYNATNVYFKEFDVDISLGIMSDNNGSCQYKYKQFLTYLTTSGTLHDMYCPWTSTGRTNVRYKGSSEINFERRDGSTYMTFKAKFNIADPVTDITEF